MARIFKPSKQTKLDAKHYELLIDRLDHQGAGLGYRSKKPVFVEGALPGEKVVVQNVEQKSKYAKAKLIKVLSQSDSRVEPLCPHYRSCGGCNLQHLDQDSQLKMKQQSLSQQMRKFAGTTIEQSAAIESSSTEYRRRVRFSCKVDKKTQQVSFGFRAKQSSAIVNIEQCPVLTPALQALVIPLRETLLTMSKAQDIGHLELIEADNTCVLLLRVPKKLTQGDKELWLEFAKQHSLSLYLQQAEQPLQLLNGDAPHYQVEHLDLAFLPSDFIQVNAKVNQSMVKQALDWLELDSDDRVLDLYCGMGNFSLPLANKAHTVIGIEGVPEMVERAANNAAANQLSNAHFLYANLEQYSIASNLARLDALDGSVNKVLLDPARAGAAGAIEQLPELNASKILYVSCNPTTLSRDSKILLENGYRLVKLGVMNMFPQTAHIESMALFEKEA